VKIVEGDSYEMKLKEAGVSSMEVLLEACSFYV